MVIMFHVVDWLTGLGVIEPGNFSNFSKFLYSRAYLLDGEIGVPSQNSSYFSLLRSSFHVIITHVANTWNTFRREADSSSMSLRLHADPTCVSSCHMPPRFYSSDLKCSLSSYHVSVPLTVAEGES